MSKITDIFPFIPKSFDKETFWKGAYSSKLPSSNYLLFNWKKNTYIVENPENTRREAVFPPHPESVYLSSLIPHPESAYLSSLIPHVKNKKTFLDVGIGSGILSIDAAQKGWNTVGVDVNNDAIKIASINAKLNDVDAKCKFQIDDLARKQQENSFDFCIANLPFEPTPSDKINFIHSDGGDYGDKLIIDFIPIVEKLMKTDGFVVIPSFSLFKNNESKLEKHLKELNNTNFIKGIIRLSKPLELSLLSSRFDNSKNVYNYLKEEGYSKFVVDIGLLKKTGGETSFIGILDNSNIADKSWTMPLERGGFTKVQHKSH